MEKGVKVNRYLIKRMLSTFLFACIPFIDLYRNVGTGLQMMLAVQSIGVVVAGIIILHYGFDKILKIYNIIWIAICISSILSIRLWFWGKTKTQWYEQECWLIAINVCLYGMIFTWWIIEKVRDLRLQNVRNRVCVISWDAISAFMWFGYITIATVVPNNIYRPGFDLLFFGMFYLVSFRKDELKDLYKDLSNGVLIGFWLIQLYAFLRKPYVDGLSRYSGLYVNSNIYDIICLVVLLLILLRLTEIRRKKTVRCFFYWFWMLQYGMIVSLILLSLGRIAIFIMLGISISYFICIFVLEGWKNKKRKVFKTLILQVIFICIAFPVTFCCASYGPRILKRPIGFQTEYLYWGDLNSDENYVSVEEYIELSMGRLSTLFMGYRTENKDTVVELVETEEGTKEEKPKDPDWEKKEYYLDENDYNAFELRYAIARTYLDNLNMCGHVLEEWWLWVSPHKLQIHAHNIFVMELFVYGIPAGTFFILWIISYFICALKYIMKDKMQIYRWLPLFHLFLVIVFGMVEMNWQPGQVSWFLLMLLFKFMFWDDDSKVSQKEKNKDNIVNLYGVE